MATSSTPSLQPFSLVTPIETLLPKVCLSSPTTVTISTAKKVVPSPQQRHSKSLAKAQRATPSLGRKGVRGKTPKAFEAPLTKDPEAKEPSQREDAEYSEHDEPSISTEVKDDSDSPRVSLTLYSSCGPHCRKP